MYIIGNEKKNRQRINYWTLTWNYLNSNPPQENNKEIGVSQSMADLNNLLNSLLVFPTYSTYQ